MKRDQKFKKSYAKELVRIAAGDFETLEVLATAGRGRPENVCFMAQQVIEKSIKAVLIARGTAIPFTHNLEILLEKLDNIDLPPEAAVIPDLTEYANIRRYEEGVINLDSEDLASALQLAKSTLDWAKGLCP